MSLETKNWGVWDVGVGFLGGEDICWGWDIGGHEIYGGVVHGGGGILYIVLIKL
jgi:hypothetical protein